MAKKNKKKVCFVITSHTHYARSSLLLQELQQHPDIELSIIVGGAADLPHYGNVPALLKKHNLPVTERIAIVVEGGTPIAMAKTTGLALIEFASVFERLKPDVVVVRGDRYEVLAAAVAAAYLNIPLAHIEGGDVTGTIDESVRHAITKFAQLHFVTNEQAHQRLRRMGEPAKSIMNIGAPEVELVAHLTDKDALPDVNTLGVGENIDLSKEFLIVMNHPVTTEYGKNKARTQALLEAVHELAVPTIWFWPNADAGTDEVAEAIRAFREKHNPAHMRFLKYLPPLEFVALLNTAACLVGNSSAGLKEASYLGVPVVNIGTRQAGRLRGKNVIDLTSYDTKAIKKAIRAQLKSKRYPRSSIYFKKGSSKNIAAALARVSPDVQKRFED